MPTYRRLSVLLLVPALTATACSYDADDASRTSEAPALTTPPAPKDRTTTVPLTNTPLQTASEVSAIAPEHAARLQALLDAHNNGEEFVGAIATVTDRSGATAVLTAGHPSLKEPAQLDPAVAWNIGSATKTFVAVVILQLVDEGRVDLDAGIDRWFPDLPDAVVITPRQLLQHTSGLAEYFDLLKGQERRRQWKPMELVALAEARGRVAAPGATHAYSNTNYLLLGEIITKVTGNPWDTEVAARITRPLGMSGTRLVDVTAAAPAHSLIDGSMVDINGRRDDPSIGGAAGALDSTTADLLRFVTALADGTLLPARLVAEMERYVPGQDYSAFGVVHGYGLGVERYETGDVVVFGHMGVGSGHSAFIGYDRQHGTAVALQFNADIPGPQAILGIELLTALAG